MSTPCCVRVRRRRRHLGRRGVQTGGASGAGDGEYHVRLVSATPGTQTVTFCADPEGNGCGDATVTDTITVTWVAATVVTTTTSPPATAPPLPPLPPPVTLPATGASTTSQSRVGLAFILAGGSLLVVRRRRIARILRAGAGTVRSEFNTP